MKLPNREEWMRIVYTCAGGGAAILWSRYARFHISGGVLLPPTVLASIILANENTGSVEKDIAAGMIGYLSTAQVISFLNQQATSSTTPIANPISNLDAEAAKLQKIKAVTGTLGAIAEIVGKFRGN